MDKMMEQVKEIKLNNDLNEEKVCTGCYIIGLLQIFLYVFDWMLSGLIMYHLKNMIINPINFILKPSKKIILYVVISGGISLIVTITSYFLDLIGKSPMITCFLTLDNIDDNDNLKIFKLAFLFFVVFIPAWDLIFFFIESLIILFLFSLILKLFKKI